MIHVATIDVYNFLVGHYGNTEGICKGARKHLICRTLHLYVPNNMR